MDQVVQLTLDNTVRFGYYLSRYIRFAYTDPFQEAKWRTDQKSWGVSFGD